MSGTRTWLLAIPVLAAMAAAFALLTDYTPSLPVGIDLAAIKENLMADRGRPPSAMDVAPITGIATTRDIGAPAAGDSGRLVADNTGDGGASNSGEVAVGEPVRGDHPETDVYREPTTAAGATPAVETVPERTETPERPETTVARPARAKPLHFVLMPAGYESVPHPGTSPFGLTEASQRTSVTYNLKAVDPAQAPLPETTDGQTLSMVAGPVMLSGTTGEAPESVDTSPGALVDLTDGEPVSAVARSVARPEMMDEEPEYEVAEPAGTKDGQPESVVARTDDGQRQNSSKIDPENPLLASGEPSTKRDDGGSITSRVTSGGSVSATNTRGTANPDNGTNVRDVAQRIRILNADLSRAIQKNDKAGIENIIETMQAMLGEDSLYMLKVRAFSQLALGGDVEYAMSLLREVLVRDPGDREAGFNMAVAEINLGENTQAKSRLKSLASSYPGDERIDDLLRSIQ